MELKPIETAPKDIEILAWFPDLGYRVTWFCDDDNVNNAGGWAIGHDYYGPPPTHWAHLPEAPYNAEA